MEKETIELVKKMIEDGNLSQEIAEKYCPELKESEDERIRKYIIKYFEASKDELSEGFKWNGITVEECIAWLEKQGEQKPADKVEPKFKIGDWISGYYTNYKVLSVNNDGYVVEDVDGNKINILFENEKFHQLWTIQDAKDGDVLVASDNSIFLFKGTIDCACKHYVALTTDGAVKFNEGLEHYWETSRAVHPATKEQCDLLFRKMKEAGYKWNADEKKLKKIEQKPAETEKGTNGNEREIPNSAWSEEDTKELDSVFSSAKHVLTDDNKKWLKNLKDRVQPKQKWSEDDERIKNNCISFLGFNKEYSPQAECIDECINWLKSLRPQKPLTNEEIEQAKKEYRDVALSKMNYIPEELTYDDGWDDAISYTKSR